MDKQLVIEPWKVELVERHFRKDLGKTSSPLSQTDVSCFSCPSTSTNISSSPVARICRPKLISKLKNPQGEGNDDVSGTSSESAFVMCRPKINKDERKFPIKQIVHDEKDHGRNCVSVILKSSSSTSKESKLSERIQILKDLSSKYPLKIEGRSQNSRRAEARLDFCFHSAKDARLFFVKVNDLFRAGACRKISVFMFAEESLGRFNIPPVLCC